MITDIEDYFNKGCGRCERFNTADCSTKQWFEGLRQLRKICLDAGLEETLKWAHPCYVYAGRNLVIIGALRNYFCLSFFNAALMKDPNGLLEKQGANTQHPNILRFTEVTQVMEMESVITAYLSEAKDYAERGIKPIKQESKLEYPDELIEALDADSELAEAFHKLTPGRQKSYILNLNSAKKSETRVARIAKFRDHIIAGKGALER